jgi:hypothetical protein
MNTSFNTRQPVRGRAQTIKAKDGRIRVTCPRCDKKRYVPIQSGVRKKQIRCVCGQSALYTINHRLHDRESIWGKAFVVLDNGNEIPIYLLDLSLGGIGFNVAPQFSRSLGCVHNARIKYRSATGHSTLRKIRITSLINNRAGAEFLDGKLPAL